MSLKNAGKNVFEKEDGALEAFRRYLELDEKSEATIRKYMHDVKVFLTFQKGKGSFRKEQIIGYKNWLGERYAVRSANSMLTAVNQFLKFVGAGECCVKLFKLQYQTFCDQRKELGREEYRRLLETARRKKQIRLYFLILTLCATGIRISELQYITVEAAVSGNTIAKNKGKSRVILIPQKLCDVLLDYAAWIGISHGPIFITRGGRPVDRSNVWRAMQKLCREAGVPEEKVYPHNLRHLFASTFYEKEKDILHLADILGHKNVNTTRIYTLATGEVHRAQIESLNLFVPVLNMEQPSRNKKQRNNKLCCFFHCGHD